VHEARRRRASRGAAARWTEYSLIASMTQRLQLWLSNQTSSTGYEVPRKISSCFLPWSRRDAVYMECVIISMCVGSCGTDAMP
jgi:hypothetical protein